MSIKEDIEMLKAELHLPKFQAPDKVEEIFDLCNSYEKLTHTDPVQLLTFATLLSSYGLFLTSETNLLSARHDHWERIIQKRVGVLAKNADGFSFKEKELFIRTNDPEAIAADEKKSNIKTLLTTISFLSLKINNLVESLTNLARARQNQARMDY